MQFSVDHVESAPLFDEEYDPDLSDHLDNLIAQCQNEFEPDYQTPSPPVEVNQHNDNLAISASIDQSREFLQGTLQIPISQLKHSGIPGLVILRLSDFATIRNDKRCQRFIPHILFLDDSKAQSGGLIENLALCQLCQQLHEFANYLSKE